MIDSAYIVALETQNRLLRKLLKASIAILALGSCLLVGGWTRGQGNDISANIIKAAQIEIAGDGGTRLVLGKNIVGDPTIFFNDKDDKPNLTLSGTMVGRTRASITLGNRNSQSIFLTGDETLSSISISGPKGTSSISLMRDPATSSLYIDKSNHALDPDYHGRDEAITLTAGAGTPPRLEIKAVKGVARFGDLGVDGLGYTVGSEKNVQLGASTDGPNFGLWLADPTSGRTLASWGFSSAEGTFLDFFNSKNFGPTLELNGESGFIRAHAPNSGKVAARWPVK
jgi:hypothetical protein